MAMTLSRDAMREYQRTRRARIKTEAWAAVGLPPPIKSPRAAAALAKDALRERAKAQAAANHPAPIAPNTQLPSVSCKSMLFVFRSQL